VVAGDETPPWQFEILVQVLFCVPFEEHNPQSAQDQLLEVQVGT